MDMTSYVALSRQVALQRHMTTLATNIANAQTTGYRAERTLFEQVLERTARPRSVAFVQDAALVRDPSPGPIAPTGNPFDIAVNGPGYLTFATPEGVRYGRAGHLTPDAAGRLVDAQGYPLLDEGGQPIVLPPGESTITITEDGTVLGRAGPIARIAIVGFADEQALERTGSGLYATEQPPLPGDGARLIQGALEGSNVQPVLEMTTMLETVRAFEGVHRLLETRHELDRQAIDRMIRTSG